MIQKLKPKKKKKKIRRKNTQISTDINFKEKEISHKAYIEEINEEGGG